MSKDNESCCVCMRMTDKCGIVAGNIPGALVCGSCASDVLDAIRQKGEERAAAEVPVTAEEQVLEALKKAEQFIVNGTELGFIKVPGMSDPAQETLPVIRRAIERMQEVSA